MRTIKFKFYDKKTGQLLEKCDMWWNYIEFLKEDEVIVCESTGLLDSKRIEMYESDIIKRNGIIHIVKWQSEKAKFVCYNPNVKHPSFWGLSSPPSTSYHIEVIGNIYENPNLLK